MADNAWAIASRDYAYVLQDPESRIAIRIGEEQCRKELMALRRLKSSYPINDNADDIDTQVAIKLVVELCWRHRKPFTALLRKLDTKANEFILSASIIKSNAKDLIHSIENNMDEKAARSFVNIQVNTISMISTSYHDMGYSREQVFGKIVSDYEFPIFILYTLAARYGFKDVQDLFLYTSAWHIRTNPEIDQITSSIAGVTVCKT